MIYAMPAPPLMHDRDGLTKLQACAEHDVPGVTWAPAPNAGSTGPRSIAGTVVVGNAEVLAGLVYHQQVKPGAPFVWGVGGRDGHAHRSRRLHHAGEPARPGGPGRPLPLVRPAELQLRGHVRRQDDRRAVRPRVRPHGHVGRPRPRHAGARRRLPRVGPAELLRIDRLRQCRGRLGQGLHEGRADRRRGAGFRRDQGGRPRRQLPGRKYTRRHARDFWYDDLFDHAVFDRWEARGRRTMLDRVKARVAELRAARPFTLDPAVRAQIDRIMQAAGKERQA